MTTKSWDEVLTELERRVALTELALDAGEAVPEELADPFEPPNDLGPLPRQLFDRAVELSHRQTALEQRLSVSMSDLGRELKATARAASSSRASSAFSETPVPRYVDRSV